MAGKTEQSSETYDAMYDSGGYQGVYDLPARRSGYLPLFKAVLAELRKLGARRVLEVGCGAGQFAELIARESGISYRGFDFSPLGISKAQDRIGKSEMFWVGDARSSDSYKWDYDAIVCTEVLEHVPEDLDVVAQWKSGVPCVCSVPNFDAASHERFFRNESDVSKRYGELITVERIRRIKKPYLTDLAPMNYFNQLRWNLTRPKRMLSILGWENFDSLGGWFLFVGRKR
jgi:cyclopropane fatty-acyl-phospholipid synthase-like methyltransferase